MPLQPPCFGRRPTARRAWARPQNQPDTRKRGRAGQRDRAQVLAEEPFCRACLERGLEVGSDEVDHIVPLHKGGADERGNKQALCKPCHLIKSTAERIAARGRRPAAD